MSERKILTTVWCCGLVLTGLLIGYGFGADNDVVMVVGILIGAVTSFAGNRLRSTPAPG